MNKINIQKIQNKKNKTKITCLTAYTAPIAKIIDNHVDIILVGDSLGSVIYGMENTQKVTLDMMMLHAKAVTNNSKNSFTIVDMPYNTYNNNKEALYNIRKMINFTKCQAIKLEADESSIGLIKYLTSKNINVVSHIGVTPQKFKDFSKIRSVGKSPKERERIYNLAMNLEKAGSCLMVIECVNETLAKKITKKLKIPTIGIGASKECDGQILVIDDILGLSNSSKKPKFVKSYLNLNLKIKKTVIKYCREIIQKKFPTRKNIYK